MIKRKLGMVLAVLLACIMVFPCMAYASDGGEAETGGGPVYEDAYETGDGETLPVDTDVLAAMLSGMDEELLDVLREHPRLIALFIPTLHVTVGESSVTISIDKAGTDGSGRTGTVTTGGARLNVRTGAGIENEIITQLLNGTKVKVIGEKDGWYQIEIPERYGYVCGEYLRVNDIPVDRAEDGYSFDIDGETILSFLSLFEDLLQLEEAQPSHGLTPSGNLTLVDDLGKRNGAGQQFITLVTKNGNYFYLIIDRDEKGEETVHFLNLVDERDLFALMEEDEQEAYQKQQAEAQAAKEAAERAAAEAAAQQTEKPEQTEKETKKVNLAPMLVIIVIMAAAGGAWFFMQTKKKKKADSEPDPDIDYTEDDEEDYGAEEDASDDYEDEEYENDYIGDESEGSDGNNEEDE